MMRRLTRRRRNRSVASSRGDDQDASERSTWRLPGSLLCGGLMPSSPPAAEPPPRPDFRFRTATISQSSPSRSTDDRRLAADAERLRKNGAVLLGGSGLQHYDNFIDTLLRERSVVTDGLLPTAVEQRKPQVNERRSVTRRLNRRRSRSERSLDKPETNGAVNGSHVTGATRKSTVDHQPSIQSTAALVENRDVTSPNITVSGRRRRSTAAVFQELDAERIAAQNVERGATLKLHTMDCSPMQRRRRSRRRGVCLGGTVAAHDRSAAACDTPAFASESQNELIDYDRNVPAVVSNGSSNLKLSVDCHAAGWTLEERVAVIVATPGCIDSINNTVEPRKNNEAEIRQSVPVGRRSDRSLNGNDVDKLQGLSLLRLGRRDGEHSVSEPLDSPSPAFQRIHSETDGSVVETRLLNTCRCFIAWPMTSDVQKESTNNVEEGPLQPTDSEQEAQVSVVSTTHISSSPRDVRPHLSSRFRKLSPLCGHQRHEVRAHTPSLSPRNSCSDKRKTERTMVFRPSIVQVFHVARRRPQNVRRGCRTAKCSLKIEFSLTRLHIKDQQTTFPFAAASPEKTNVDANHVNSTVLNEALQCHLGACPVTDVTLSVIDGLAVSTGQNTNSTEKSVELESLTLTLPTSVSLAFSFPDRMLYSTIDISRLRSRSDSDYINDVTVGPDDVISDDVADLSQSVIIFEFAEVVSIFNNFAADLIPSRDDGLSLVLYEDGQRQDRGGGPSTELVRRPGPASFSHRGEVVPYGAWRVFVPIPLMTWTWSDTDYTGTSFLTGRDDVMHLPHISACKTISVEPTVDNFTLVITEQLCLAQNVSELLYANG